MMLKQVDITFSAAMMSRKIAAGNKVSKKYRNRMWKRECRNLKSIIPTIAKKRVSDVEVIEEAAEYIEQLHRAIAQRLGVFPCPQMIAALHMQHKMKSSNDITSSQNTNTATTHPMMRMMTQPTHMYQQDSYMDNIRQQKLMKPVLYRI